MTDYDGFRVERDEARRVATITLDVPGKFNRVSMGARDQLAQLFAELGRDDAIGFVVVTGAGETFTAGGDVVGFAAVAAPLRCRRIAKFDEVRSSFI